MNYCIWNNKGGVGKTFLTFALACEHAFLYPEKTVIVADLSPQADLSELLLGNHYFDLLCNSRKTIGGYFETRILSPHNSTGKEAGYLLPLHLYNENLPATMSLLCGDPALELQAQVIPQIAGQILPKKAWKHVHLWAHDLIQACSQPFSDVDVFIDCSANFSAITELALCAAERLLIPCAADSASCRALRNVQKLVYERTSFFEHCIVQKIPLPLVHAILCQDINDGLKKAAMQFHEAYPYCFAHEKLTIQPIFCPSELALSLCQQKILPHRLIAENGFSQEDIQRFRESLANILS